jgi:hypothetical protein
VQLQRWKRIPEFRLRIHEHLAEVRKTMLACTLTETDNQLALLMASVAAIRGIIRSRGETNVDAPGALMDGTRCPEVLTRP